jgi:hydroxyacylglutathione hydrolase
LSLLFERVVAEGIAHNSYIIGAGGKAAVIDPRRDCEIYLEIAARNHVTISHIFETHRNEDYVIGSRELQARCGAEIFHGAALDFSYGKPVREGDTFTFGPISLEVLETPGHTDESITLVLRDKEVGDTPCMIFCGDTLFAGDIARTDFFGQARKEEMAKKIFDSISQKILPLGDGAILCPAHGAGSVCGGDITDHPFTSIGYEKATNPHLMGGRDRFIARRKTESPYVPPYFRKMEEHNKEGAPLLHHLPVLRPLSTGEVNAHVKSGSQILDIRAPTGFGAGHIPGSLSIWREGIPAYAGWVLTYDNPILIIDDFNLEIETVVRQLVRLGYDNITGILNGGFPAWSRGGGTIGTVPTCSVQQLEDNLNSGDLFLLDVRDIKNRLTFGHIAGSYHVYVGELHGHIADIPRDKPVCVYCDAGYKGSLAASILARHNYHNITNVLGGMTGWINAGFEVRH